MQALDTGETAVDPERVTKGPHTSPNSQWMPWWSTLGGRGRCAALDRGRGNAREVVPGGEAFAGAGKAPAVPERRNRPPRKPIAQHVEFLLLAPAGMKVVGDRATAGEDVRRFDALVVPTGRRVGVPRFH